MAVMVDEIIVDAVPGGETPPQQRGSGGGDAGSNSGGEPPKPEEMERAWKQQIERAERTGLTNLGIMADATKNRTHASLPDFYGGGEESPIRRGSSTG